jgi:hypothetical protein
LLWRRADARARYRAWVMQVVGLGEVGGGMGQFQGLGQAYIPTPSDRWDKPSLDAKAVAALLGTTPAAVRQHLLHDERFPRPETRGANGRNLWVPAVIFRYIRTVRPRHRHRVPRLWAQADLNPAQLVDSRTVCLPGGFGADPYPREWFVVHEWRPSDDRRPIAIGYPLNLPGDQPRRDAKQAAHELFWALGAQCDAVAIPQGRADTPWLPDDGRDQPTMVVVDHASVDADALDDRAVVYAWSELAWLLQTDVPWWPAALRDPGAMLAWRPGDRPVQVMPQRGHRSPRVLLNLLTDATPTEVRRATLGVATDMADELTRSGDGITDYPERPGLIHAAHPVALGEPPRDRSPRDVVNLLHHQVADESLAGAAGAALAGAGAAPAVTTVMTISPDLASDPLVARWLAGLQPATPGQCDELGYRVLQCLRRDDANRPIGRVTQWCTHRSDPDCWAAITSTGAVYTTVGSSAPAATGQLESALVTYDAAFFETTAGEVWPLPHLRATGYNAGYGGTDPQALTQTLSRLLRDAAADVESAAGEVPTVASVWEAVRARPLPLRWTAPPPAEAGTP